MTGVLVWYGTSFSSPGFGETPVFFSRSPELVSSQIPHLIGLERIPLSNEDLGLEAAPFSDHGLSHTAEYL